MTNSIGLIFLFTFLTCALCLGLMGSIKADSSVAEKCAVVAKVDSSDCNYRQDVPVVEIYSGRVSSMCGIEYNEDTDVILVELINDKGEVYASTGTISRSSSNPLISNRFEMQKVVPESPSAGSLTVRTKRWRNRSAKPIVWQKSNIKKGCQSELEEDK